MSRRAITLHVFCSAKGGVGKSTLAVAMAKLLAKRLAISKRRCVLIDADLTGTSLADGLDLRAPVVSVSPDGVLDFFAEPAGRWLTRDETVKARNLRRSRDWEGLPPAPPYVNDILIRGERGNECRVESLLWKHEQDDEVGFLPSSPLRQDISIALGWIRGEAFDWLQRFMWLLDGMREQIPSLSDVVIDLPPGLVGFAHETLALLSNLARNSHFPSGFPSWNPVEWKGRPFLVTTEDRNDFLLALEYWQAQTLQEKYLPNLEIVLNRANQGRTDWMRDQISKHFGGVIRMEDVPWVSIGESERLRKLFVDGYLAVNDDVLRLLGPLLGDDNADP